MRLNCICPVPHAHDVVLVPQLGLGVGRSLGMGMERALVGADDGPSALGLHAPHGGFRARQQVTHAAAVRHLEEAVARRYRADLHGFEEDIESGIAGHELLH